MKGVSSTGRAALTGLCAGIVMALSIVSMVSVVSAAAPERLSIRVGNCTLESLAGQRIQLEALGVRARTLLPMIERDLGVAPAAPYRIILIPAGRLSDPEIARLDASAPRWAAGFIFPALRIGAIRIARADRYPYSDLASVLVHESVHMILFDAAGRGFPRWFGEGVATVLERSWGLRDIVVFSSSLLTGALPTLREMDEAFAASNHRSRTAYAASFDFMMYTVRLHGKEVLGEIIRETSRRPFAEAWEVVTGTTLLEAETRWRRGSLITYRWVPAITGTTTLWIAITLLALTAIARRRRRSREILERWEREGDFGQEW